MGTDLAEDKIRAAEERQKAFEEKYAEVIDTLKGMPVGTKEARRQRWEWFRGLEIRDDFKLDLIQVIRPHKLEKIKRYLSGMPEDKRDGHYAQPPEDVGMVHRGVKLANYFDPLVFEEALKKVVESYKAGEGGKEHSLVACMRKEYEQVGALESAKNTMNENAGIAFGIRERRMGLILKLVSHVKNLTDVKRKEKEPVTREMIEEFICGMGKDLSREEIRTAVCLVEGIKSISLDQDETREVLEKERQDLLNAGEGADPYRGIASDGIQDFFEALAESAESGFREIQSASGKRDRELIKAFISKEILIAMKLEYLREDDRARWKEELEPKCGQWCRLRESCRYERKDGCYVRYGKIIPSEEAGDEEFYDCLSKNADRIYKFLVKNDYTDYAFKEKIGSLYDVYAKKLKDFKGEGETFQFTDAVMGQALGLKPYAISRSRKQYETKIKPQLKEIFSRTREE